MDQNKIIRLSHVFVIAPSEDYWDVLPYISATERNGSLVYRRGQQGWRELEPSEIQQLVDRREVVAISPQPEIGTAEEVFLTPSSEIVIANKENAKADPNRRTVGQLPNSGKLFFRQRWKLQAAGVDPDALAGDDIPMEMRKAAERFLEWCAQQRPTRQTPFYSEAKYGSSESGIAAYALVLRKLQEVIHGELSSLLNVTIQSVSGNHFDDQINAAFAQRWPIIAGYVFFLSNERRSAWGVIPYGWQREIGIMIHKKHPSHNDISVESRQWTEGSRDPATVSRSQQLLVEVLTQMLNKPWSHREVMMFQGYIFYDVLQDLLEKFADEKTWTSVQPFMKQWPREQDVASAAALGKIMAKDEVGQVFFFDPAELGIVSDAAKSAHMGSAYSFFRLPHGMAIPAGIGFSLPAFPLLTKDGAWRKLLNAAKDTFTNDDIDTLANCGIEIQKGANVFRNDVIKETEGV